jgi:hypothetical protein
MTRRVLVVRAARPPAVAQVKGVRAVVAQQVVAAVQLVALRTLVGAPPSVICPLMQASVLPPSRFSPSTPMQMSASKPPTADAEAMKTALTRKKSVRPRAVRARRLRIVLPHRSAVPVLSSRAAVGQRTSVRASACRTPPASVLATASRPLAPAELRGAWGLPLACDR